MRTVLSICILSIFLSGSLLAQEGSSDPDNNWPQWRGPDASGVAPEGNPPIEFSEDKNVKWKVEIPGTGHATPIVWGDQMILLSAVPTEQKVESAEQSDQDGAAWMKPNKTDLIHKFMVISVDRKTGAIQWQTKVNEELPSSHTHQLGSWASNSPVTDGEHIWAYFGSHGLYCLDMTGKIVWDRDFGIMEKRMSFGEGSSPLLYKDKLYILRDHEGQSTLHALNKKTGKVLWMNERDERSSWSTPFIITVDGQDQLYVAGTGRIRSFDPQTGEEIWNCGGMTENLIPMPVVDNGILYQMSGFRGNALLAIDLSQAKGDITDTEAIIWSYGMNTPYTPSPILMNGLLFFMKSNNGFLSCLDAKDGTEYYVSEKLEGIKNIYASPTGVNNCFYVPGAEGTFVVMKASANFDIMASNVLDDGFHASPVIIGDELYLRGFRHLYCIAAE